MEVRNRPVGLVQRLTGRDPLELLSGVIKATGVPQAASDMQWTATHPVDRLMGRGRADNGQMMLPIGPWGGIGAGLRTGPARSMQVKLKQQAMLDMYRDAKKSIDRAPQSSFMDNYVESQIKELNMRRMGMGRDQLQNRLLERNAGQRAWGDQMGAAWDDLQSLFPDPAAIPHMDPMIQNSMRSFLTGTRDKVEGLMRDQKVRQIKSRRGPEHLTPIQESRSVPAEISYARDLISRALHEQARRSPHNPQIRSAIQKYPGQAPGRSMTERYWTNSKDRPG